MAVCLFSAFACGPSVQPSGEVLGRDARVSAIAQPKPAQPKGEGHVQGTSAKPKDPPTESSQASAVVERNPFEAAFRGVSGAGMAGLVPELSGLVASRKTPGRVWGLGDSGQPAHLYAVDWQVEAGTWQLAREYKIEGVKNIDWEDIAVDDQGRLYIADIGNNLQRRRRLMVHRVIEPGDKAAGETLAVDATLVYDYPNRTSLKNYDAESLFWHNDHLYVATKHRSDTRSVLYRLPAFPKRKAAGAKKPVLAERLGEFDVGGSDRLWGGMTTAADLDGEGRWLALMSYHAMFVFDVREGLENGFGRLVHKFDLRQEITAQNEAVAWLPTGQLMIANEPGGAFIVDAPLDTKRTIYPASLLE